MKWILCRVAVVKHGFEAQILSISLPTLAQAPVGSLDHRRHDPP